MQRQRCVCRCLLWTMLMAVVALFAADSAPAGGAAGEMQGLQKIALGGMDQWILTRGQSDKNPIILFLHGGPGMPIISFFRDLDVDAKLESRFTMVYWDQRGAGKSFDSSIPLDSMNIKQFVADTHELTNLLRERFSVDKIYLMGHSWGSVIGVLAVSQQPQLYHAYIGIGQVVNMHENEIVSYRLVYDEAVKKQDERAIRELSDIGPPPYSDYRKMIVEREWARRFARDVSPKKETAAIITDVSLLESMKWMHGPFFSLKHLWSDLQKVDLFQQAPQLNVPVFLFAGRHDYQAPSAIAERYFQELNAPAGKEMIWFENSSHAPFSEEPEKFYITLVNRILQD